MLFNECQEFIPDVETIKDLFSRGAKADLHYGTLTMFNTRNMSPEILKLFVENDCPLRWDSLDTLPKRIIRNNMGQNTIRLLHIVFEKHQCVNMTAPNNMTPLHIACLIDDLPVIEYLLEIGAEPDAVDINLNAANALCGEGGYKY